MTSRAESFRPSPDAASAEAQHFLASWFLQRGLSRDEVTPLAEKFPVDGAALYKIPEQ